jgi:hypothetical protein
MARDVLEPDAGAEGDRGARAAVLLQVGQLSASGSPPALEGGARLELVEGRVEQGDHPSV